MYKLEYLIEEIINSFKETSSKKIELNVDNDKNKIDIRRTPEIIYGLRNFIGNAVKFSKSRVKIILKSDDKIIEIKITDDGPGIPIDQYKNVFKPFYRLDNSRNLNQSGVGLGLSIAEDIVRSHGGNIQLNENKYKGLQVKIFLPS